MKKIIPVPQKCNQCGAISSASAPADWGQKYGHRTPENEPCSGETIISSATVNCTRAKYRKKIRSGIQARVGASFHAEEVNDIVFLFDYLERNKLAMFLNNETLRNVQGKFLRMRKRFEE